MASWTGRFSVVAILIWVGSTSAQAQTYARVLCNGIESTGFGFAHCSQGRAFGSAPGIEVTGRGEASADLGTGALRARSVAAGERSATDPADAVGAIGNAIAGITDTITIGGGFTGPVEIHMEASGAFLLNVAYGSRFAGKVEAAMSAFLAISDSANPPSGYPTAQASVSVTQWQSEFLVYPEFPFTWGNAFLSTNAGASGNFANPADVRIVLSTIFDVTSSARTFSLEARLAAGTEISPLAIPPGEILVSDLDFGNSAYLSLILPAGVPWTSESGVFLQAVPELSTGALLAAGLLCLGAVSRVRRARASAGTRSPQA